MRAARALICAAALATVGAATFGQPPAAAPNGCGSGWNTYLVPDSLPVLGCRFETACNRHDQCYGKCIPGAPDALAPACEYLRCRAGGDLEGQAECESAAFAALRSDATQRRQICDRAFYDDLQRSNRDRRPCAAFALLYREAVVLFGAGSFFGAGPEVADRAPEIRVPQDSQKAIDDFLRKGSDRQLDELIRRLDAATPELDLGQPLKYDRWRGLTN